MFASCTVELRLPPKQTADSQPVSLAQLKPVCFVCCECPCHRCPRLLVLPPRKPSRIPRHHALSLHTCTHGTVPVTISVSRKGQGKSGGFKLSPAQHSPRAPPFPITHLVACPTPRPSPIPCPHHALTCVRAHSHTRTHPPSRHHPLPHPPSTVTLGPLERALGSDPGTWRHPLACSCDVTLCGIV